ncbi:PAS domain-containing sensor histidine kinase [Cyanobacteria bacterium FACHB-63]|nr:PAS domain-containing sensor histidine kinase [Cyanobacteria bacterium FACHB-63]
MNTAHRFKVYGDRHGNGCNRSCESSEINTWHNGGDVGCDRPSALQSGRETYQSLSCASSSPIAITTVSDQRFVDVNSSYLKLSGCSLEEIFNSILNDLKIGVLQDEYNQAMQQALAEGSVQNQEVKFRTRSGDQRSVLLSIEPIDLSGTACMLNIILDITECKRLENELIFLVSHELRTPMASLLGALELLSLEQFGHLTSQGRKVLNIATMSTKRLTCLSNDILDLERMRSGKVTLQKVRCNIAKLLMEAAESMQAMANSADVSLIISVLNLELLIDADRFLQTLANLLNNAIKFSEPKGKIWLTATQPEEHSILIKVRDQRRGIPQDKLRVIFDRSSRLLLDWALFL